MEEVTQARTVEELLSMLTEDVIQAAKSVLGWQIHFTPDSGPHLIGEIVETEAYTTPDDPACHAFRGKTPRNETLFGPPGHAYVYFTYGNHWMLNITGFEAGRAAAILIRAMRPVEGAEVFAHNRKVLDPRQWLSGPGKLCQAFGINRSHNGLNLLDETSQLRLVCPPPPLSGALEPKKLKVESGVRIGITLGREHLWRFVDWQNKEFASKPLPPKYR